jgi:2-(1,2-epoxy-1,2-dihydrophenyl)acetyl-CoA isomerase
VTSLAERSTVRLERAGAVAHVVLARPNVGNAINLQTVRELRAAFESCAADRSVRAVLLRAEGSAFCVGGDLVEFESKGAERPAHLATLASEFHAAQALLMTMRAPVVVAVQGAAAGAGMGLALCGDVVLAAAGAHFTAAYTAIGLSANGGSTHLLPRLVGLRRAQELLLTNRRLSAAEALDWGLVTAVMPESDVRPGAEDVARRLAEGPTEAHGVIKRLLAHTYDRSFLAQTEVEGAEIARLSGRPDAAEGIAAFRAKRRPAFEGEPPE